MSRKTKARRKARKARAPSKRFNPVGWTEPWGSGPPLTPEQRERVLSRYSDMRGRSVRFGFVFPVGWVNARNPEELEEAVRVKLAADSKGKPQN